MNKVRKGIAICTLCAFVVSGCQNKNKQEDTGKNRKIPIVSVAQIVQHKSLNEIRDSFTAELETLGYQNGKNIRLDFKDAGGQQTNLNSIMSTFAGNKSDVIVAIATPTALAAAKYSKQIPIVFSAVSDPVGAGLMKDLQKTDSNITGTSDEIQVEQILTLARKVQPNLKTLGFLYNSSEANSISNLAKAEKFCKEHNIKLVKGSGINITEIQSALSVLVDKSDAIFAPNDNTVASSISALVSSANKKKIPVYTGADSMVSEGGFATVGINYSNLGKQTARMVDKILKGEKVANIPVQVFKENLNIYVNENTRNILNIELPKEIREDKNLIIMK